MNRLHALILSTFILLSACGSEQVVHRRDSFVTQGANGQPDSRLDVVTTDGQQRLIAILHGTAYATDRDSTPWTLCAEPSPDTMTSITSNTAAALMNSHVSAEVASAFASQAAMIGLRTQSITLMRDEAYRLCEGYLNKAIDGPMYTLLHRRFQNLMIANLAIEQLTGYARPSEFTIGGSGTSSSANDLLDTQAALDKATKDASTAKDNSLTAQKASDENKIIITKGDTSTTESKAALAKANADKAKLDATLAGAKQHQQDTTDNVASLSELMKNARTATASNTSPGSNTDVPVKQKSPTSSDMVAVANVVAAIVANATDKDLTGDFCLDYFLGHKDQTDPVYQECLLRLNQQQIQVRKDKIMLRME